MTPNEYQRLAGRTQGPDTIVGLATSGLGIAGEAGEVADIIKKAIGHGHTVDVVALKKELGDVLWYVADLSTRYSLHLEAVMEANIAKLEARYPEGFSHERSMNRVA